MEKTIPFGEAVFLFAQEYRRKKFEKAMRSPSDKKFNKDRAWDEWLEENLDKFASDDEQIAFRDWRPEGSVSPKKCDDPEEVEALWQEYNRQRRDGGPGSGPPLGNKNAAGPHKNKTDNGIKAFTDYPRDPSSYENPFPGFANKKEADEIAKYQFGLGKYEDTGKLPHKEEEVDLDKLCTNQDFIKKSTIKNFLDSGKSADEILQLGGPPLVIKCGDTMMISDGNHRLSFAKHVGLKKAKVEVVDLGRVDSRTDGGPGSGPPLGNKNAAGPHKMSKQAEPMSEDEVSAVDYWKEGADGWGYANIKAVVNGKEPPSVTEARQKGNDELADYRMESIKKTAEDFKNAIKKAPSCKGEEAIRVTGSYGIPGIGKPDVGQEFTIPAYDAFSVAPKDKWEGLAKKFGAEEQVVFRIKAPSYFKDISGVGKAFTGSEHEVLPSESAKYRITKVSDENFGGRETYLGVSGGINVKVVDIEPVDKIKGDGSFDEFVNREDGGPGSGPPIGNKNAAGPHKGSSRKALSDEEKTAIVHFTGDNKALTPKEEQHIENAISNASKLDDQYIYSRGISMTKEQLDKFIDEGRYEPGKLTSWTMDENVALNYAEDNAYWGQDRFPVVLQYRGSGQLDKGMEVSKYSQHPEEDEAVFSGTISMTIARNEISNYDPKDEDGPVGTVFINLYDSRRDGRFDYDEEPDAWITVNGNHIPIDEDGNPIGGQLKSLGQGSEKESHAGKEKNAGKKQSPDKEQPISKEQKQKIILGEMFHPQKGKVNKQILDVLDECKDDDAQAVKRITDILDTLEPGSQITVPVSSAGDDSYVLTKKEDGYWKSKSVGIEYWTSESTAWEFLTDEGYRPYISKSAQSEEEKARDREKYKARNFRNQESQWAGDRSLAEIRDVKLQYEDLKTAGAGAVGTDKNGDEYQCYGAGSWIKKGGTHSDRLTSESVTVSGDYFDINAGLNGMEKAEVSRLRDAFYSMPPEVRSLYEQTFRKHKVRPSEDGYGAYFAPTEEGGTVHINSMSDAEAFIHEMSHALDRGAVDFEYDLFDGYKLHVTSASQNLDYLVGPTKKAYEDDFETMSKIVGFKTNGDGWFEDFAAQFGSIDVYAEWAKKHANIKGFDAVSDAISGMTLNNCGASFFYGGHDTTYWMRAFGGSNTSAQSDEYWANFCMLKAFGYTEALDLLKTITPNRYAAAEATYKEAFKRQRRDDSRRRRADKEEPDSWITLENGEHVPLDKEGNALGGAGGWAKGKKFSEAKSTKRSVSSTGLKRTKKNVTKDFWNKPSPWEGRKPLTEKIEAALTGEDLKNAGYGTIGIGPDGKNYMYTHNGIWQKIDTKGEEVWNPPTLTSEDITVTGDYFDIIAGLNGMKQDEVSELRDVYNNMPPEMQAVYENTFRSHRVRPSREGEGPYFSPHEDGGTVHIDPNAGTEAFLHEMSHAIDEDSSIEGTHHGAISNRMDKLVGYMVVDLESGECGGTTKETIDDFETMSKIMGFETNGNGWFKNENAEIKGRTAWLKWAEQHKSIKGFSRVSDAVSGMTHDIILCSVCFGGHSLGYWDTIDNPGMQNKEYWADFCTLKTHGYTEALDLLKQLTPNRYAAAETAYKEKFKHGKK